MISAMDLAHFRIGGGVISDLTARLRFKEEIKRQGDMIWEELGIEKEAVSVHFRRTDYLELSSLNLSLDYYRRAVSCFNMEKSVFVVFSDDIEGVKELPFIEGSEVIYMSAHSAAVDMYLMTLCKHNIIANSTFSFWGACLNKHEGKRVVCPHDFIGAECVASLYLNGNYYPTDWVAISEE